ncbi:MAG: DUF3127 domain-containing protein, partial [Bacteroidales bacterium]|nr:DUF3127 domain-containing protein [Bacteroidales bacterium]
PLQSGTSERGDWRSQDVLIESMEQREQSQARLNFAESRQRKTVGQSTEQVQYPDRFLLHLSGSAVDQLQGISEGDIVEAMWSSNVRSFTRKDGSGETYMQEHRCWKITKIDNQPF